MRYQNHRQQHQRQAARTRGFTLIELMIAVSIIGILLSLSIPAYLDYATRSKVSEAIQMATASKVSIMEFYISNGALPASMSEAGIADISTRYIASVNYERMEASDDANETGFLTITLSPNAGSAVANKKLLVQAEVMDSGLIEWQCLPAETDGVPVRFLPSICRGA